MINALIFNHIFQCQRPAQHLLQQQLLEQNFHQHQQLLEQQVYNYLVILVYLITLRFYETLNYKTLNPFTEILGSLLFDKVFELIYVGQEMCLTYVRIGYFSHYTVSLGKCGEYEHCTHLNQGQWKRWV